jgi:hypothetical protein
LPGETININASAKGTNLINPLSGLPVYLMINGTLSGNKLTDATGDAQFSVIFWTADSYSVWISDNRKGL